MAAKSAIGKCEIGKLTQVGSISTLGELDQVYKGSQSARLPQPLETFCFTCRCSVLTERMYLSQPGEANTPLCVDLFRYLQSPIFYR